MLTIPNFGNYKPIFFNFEYEGTNHRGKFTEVHGTTYWWFLYVDGGELCATMKYDGDWTFKTNGGYMQEKKQEFIDFLVSYYQ